MNIPQFLDKYLTSFQGLINKIEITKSPSEPGMNFHDGVKWCVELIRNVERNNNKIIFIGNGGSAAIASHQAIDFWNTGRVKAIAFNDSSLLTCMANDFGYSEVFAKPMEIFANQGDIAICISSSGSSPNILNATVIARQRGCSIITLSGFEQDNPLRTKGDLNFYVPSFSYGMVEILHLLIIHTLLDAKIYCFDQKDIFYKNQTFKKQHK